MKSHFARQSIIGRVAAGIITGITTVSLLACIAAVNAAPGDLDSPALKRRQEAQQRARLLARDLLKNVVELQIQQLEENGLQGLPVYNELVSLQNSLDEIAEKEMAAVIELLSAAQVSSGKQREAKFLEARGLVREIVAKLTAERQNLRRRLKSAELLAQIDQLIERQTTVQTGTSTLSAQAQLDRERSALALREDQRDCQQLFEQLVTTLAEVAGWEGELATTAANAVKSLNDESTGADFDAVAKHFAIADFESAVQGQQRILDALKRLRERIVKKTETTSSSDAQREATARQVQNISQQQSNLLEQTRSATPETAADLLDAQAAIDAQLQQLSSEMPTNSALQPVLDAARTASQEATAGLFEAQPESAAAAQQRVLAALQELDERLAANTPSTTKPSSAAELSATVTALEQLAQAIAPRLQEQQQVGEQLDAGNQPAAQQLQQQVADSLPRPTRNPAVPAIVERRLAEAVAASESAAARLAVAQNAADSTTNDAVTTDAATDNKNADGSSKSDPSSAGADAASQLPQKTPAAAVHAATAALDKAAAEIAEQLADAQRRALGLRAGELARAAEVTERAAAEQRSIAAALADTAAEQTKAAESGTPIPKPTPADNSARSQQLAVAAVVDQVKTAIQPLAGETGKTAVADAQAAVSRVLNDLPQQTTDPTFPSTESTPAIDPAKSRQTADAAKVAAESLGNAAAALREELKDTAQTLTQITQQQRRSVDTAMSQVAALQDQMKGAAGKNNDAPNQPGKTDAAMTDQDKAIAQAVEATARQSREADVGATAALHRAAAATRGEPQSAAESVSAAQNNASPNKSPNNASDKGSETPATDAATPGASSDAASDPKNATNGLPTAKTADENVRQAAASLQARALQLERDAELANMLISQAEEQSLAAENLAKQRAERNRELAANRESNAKAANTSGKDGANPQANAGAQSAGENNANGPDKSAADSKENSAAAGSKPKPVNAELAMAIRKFANSQRAIGEGAEQISGQSQVGSPPLREALQKASEFGQSPKANAPASHTEKRNPQSATDAANDRAANGGKDSASSTENAAGNSGASEKPADPNAAGNTGASPPGGNAPPTDASSDSGSAEPPPSGGSGAGNSDSAATMPASGANGQASQGTGTASGTGSGEGTPGENAIPEGSDPTGDSPSSRDPSGNRRSGNSDRRNMGSGLVPANPEQTAAMMAGETPGEASAAVPGDGDPDGSQSGQGGEQGSSEQGGEDSQSAAGKANSKSPSDSARRDARNGFPSEVPASDGAPPTGTQSQDGTTTGSKPGGQPNNSRGQNTRPGADANQPGQQSGPSDPSANGRTPAGQETNSSRDVTQQPWFARLPPDVRKAMRANAERPAPRAYEERLKKYYRQAP